VLFLYLWDLVGLAWQIVEGAEGPPGEVDLPELDARYILKGENDMTAEDVVTTFRVLRMLQASEDATPVFMVGLNAADTLVKVTPATAAGDKTFYFEQTPAATVWTLDHNLGKRPGYTARDGSGSQIFGTPAWPTLNQMTLTFTSAVSGDVTLN
jgi:hypothetical protein